MNLNICFMCVLLKVSLGSEPQVYETFEDQAPVRVVRQPFSPPAEKVYAPPTFQFHKTVQQDQRQARYAQQQKMDLRNIQRMRKAIEGATKLNPNSYYEDKIKRQDSNKIIYINSQTRPEYDVDALNALVGQHPDNQLEGLKRLLHAPQSAFALPLIKGPLPHPIVEQSQDVPNPNTHPNVDTDSIHNIQSQLDEAAKAQFAKALADAEELARAQVEAQHQAIARAQVEAQKKALAQIALHNRRIKEKQQVPVQLYAPTHEHEATKPIVIKQSPSAHQRVVVDTPKHHQIGLHNVDEHQYASRYAFGYKIRDVKMGNEFGHEEKRDGENAKGLYHVLLPDGRMQKVEYYADPTGYHAKVTYQNLAHH